jgi:hypothetical protein
VQLWCAIRDNKIEEIFHRTSGVEKRYQADYTTIDRGLGNSFLWLNSEDEIINFIAKAKDFISGEALSLMERDYSYMDYSALLNDDPGNATCPYHANPENRCHHGLISAKLASDARYGQLLSTYSGNMRKWSNGFYYPRFERLVADLDALAMESAFATGRELS